MYSSSAVAWSSDKHGGNILTVPQDLPACVVVMIAANLNGSPVDLVPVTTNNSPLVYQTGRVVHCYSIKLLMPNVCRNVTCHHVNRFVIPVASCSWLLAYKIYQTILVIVILHSY